MKLVKEDKHGLWTRKDTYDEKTIEEAFRCYKHLRCLVIMEVNLR